MGRALPYGEGVTYWPLGEMVKAAAGISDDDPLEEAFEKLRACCEEEAIADVLGLAAGVLEALEGERSAQEISWATREVMHNLADVQPLVLFFEDIHWAEEPLLDLIEHLADRVRAPLLIVCLARTQSARCSMRSRSGASAQWMSSKRRTSGCTSAIPCITSRAPHAISCGLRSPPG